MMDINDPKLARTKMGKRLRRMQRFLEQGVRGLRVLRIANSGARGGYILELAWRVEDDQLPAWDEAYPVIASADQPDKSHESTHGLGTRCNTK